MDRRTLTRSLAALNVLVSGAFIGGGLMLDERILTDYGTTVIPVVGVSSLLAVWWLIQHRPHADGPSGRA